MDESNDEGDSSFKYLDPIQRAERNWRIRGWDVGVHFRLALSIVRIEEIIREANLEVFGQYKLTNARHEALSVLYFAPEGELPLARLSERLMVHPTSVTSTVDGLERLGYVVRVPHATDRRKTLARLTPEGQRVVEETVELVAARDTPLTALSDVEAEAVYESLSKVRERAGDFGSPTAAESG